MAKSRATQTIRRTRTVTRQKKGQRRCPSCGKFM